MAEAQPKTDQVLGVLGDGPATTGEVAAELGWTVHLACAHLKNLFKAGRVARQPFPTGDRRRRFLWSLPEPEQTRERSRIQE